MCNAWSAGLLDQEYNGMIMTGTVISFCQVTGLRLLMADQLANQCGYIQQLQPLAVKMKCGNRFLDLYLWIQGPCMAIQAEMKRLQSDAAKSQLAICQSCSIVSVICRTIRML